MRSIPDSPLVGHRDLDPLDGDLGGGRAEPEVAYDPNPPILRWCIACLVVGGLFYAVLALALGPPGGGVAGLLSLERKASAPSPQLTSALEIFVLVLCCFFALLNFVGAWGLHKRTKVGWVLALIGAVIYTASICFPFGLVLLIGLLKADVRKACGF